MITLSPLVSDNAPQIRDAVSLCASEGGGVVNLAPGTWLVASQVVVPSRVVLRGAGSRSTLLLADPTFPVNTSVVKMEEPGTNPSFSNRVEELMVDCRNRTGVSGVEMVDVNNQGGARGVVVTRYRGWAFKVSGFVGAIAGSSGFAISDIDCVASVNGCLGAISIDGCPGRNTLDGLIGVTAASGPGGSYGIKVKNSFVSIRQLGVERQTHALYLDTGAYVDCYGVEGHSTVANVVTFAPGAGACSIMGISCNGATGYAVLDLVDGKSIASGDGVVVPFYVQSNMTSPGVALAPARFRMWFRDGLNLSAGGLWLEDGVDEPVTKPGLGTLYLDALSGELRVKFGNGVVKTIATKVA